MISVLLADGHRMFFQGLVRLLGDDDRFFPVYEASNGFEAMACIRTFQPDVAILALDLPKRDGILVASMASVENLATRCVVLTLRPGGPETQRVLLSGARGVLSKEAGFGELATLVAGIAAGKCGPVSQGFVPALKRLKRVRGRFGLSRREEEILAMVGRGLTSKKIAAALFISSRTVDSHRMRIMAKLEIGNGPGLVRFALENGIL